MSTNPAPEPVVPPAFSIKVANGMYLDNHNEFHTGTPPKGPVYDIAGGALSLSAQTVDGLVKGTLAILPLAKEEGWKSLMRDQGVPEATLKLLGKVAGFGAMAVTVIGMLPAATKLAQMVGFLKEEKSVEQLAQEILTKLGVVQDMVADSQGSAVKALLDTSISRIGAVRDQVEGAMGLLINHDAAERRARRADMLDKVDLLDAEVRAVLSGSRWDLFNQSKQYVGSWAFMTDREAHEIVNPPWWGAPRYVPRVRLSDDGKSWVPAVYPAAYQTRFDYRASLPVALQAIMSYIGALTMAEPEFRSTVRSRLSLLAIAAAIDPLLRAMRGVFVRSQYSPGDFVYAAAADQVLTYDPDGVFGPLPSQHLFRRPHFAWQVGAHDLCAYTDSYFTELGLRRPVTAASQPWPVARYKLGTVDFDWVPPSPQLVLVSDTSPLQGTPPNPPHWAITNGQACADAANAQSEQDFMVALQASGYFQLAQLHATLLHLASDPDSSETVTGQVQRRRERAGSSTVSAVGVKGSACTVQEVTATGHRVEHDVHSTVDLRLQNPDRVNQLPTRILLVALSAPAGSGAATLLSETELHVVNTAVDVTLSQARTFDWYLPQGGVAAIKTGPSHAQLLQMAQRRIMAITRPSAKTSASETSWVQLEAAMNADELPGGSARNLRTEAVTLNCLLRTSTTDDERSATVEVLARHGSRNIRDLYVVVEEALGSGQRLRSYFDVWSNTQLTYLPTSFFEAERRCLQRTARIKDQIDRYYTDSVPPVHPPQPPAYVPQTLDAVIDQIETVRANAPEVMAHATAALAVPSDDLHAVNLDSLRQRRGDRG